MYKNIYNYLLFKRYYEILIILENSKTQVYNNFFINRLSKFYLSYEKLDNENLNIYKNEYIKLVLETCGPNIVNDLEKIKGNMASIVLDIETFFINKMIQDEEKIFKSADQKNRGELSESEFINSLNNIKNT